MRKDLKHSFLFLILSLAILNLAWESSVWACNDDEACSRLFEKMTFAGESFTAGYGVGVPLEERFRHHLEKADKAIKLPEDYRPVRVLISMDLFGPPVMPVYSDSDASEDEAREEIVTRFNSLMERHPSNDYDQYYLGSGPTLVHALYLCGLDVITQNAGGTNLEKIGGLLNSMAFATSRVKLLQDTLRELASGDEHTDKIVLMDMEQNAVCSQTKGIVFKRGDKEFPLQEVVGADARHPNALGQAFMLNLLIEQMNKKNGFEIPFLIEDPEKAQAEVDALLKARSGK